MRPENVVPFVAVVALFALANHARAQSSPPQSVPAPTSAAAAPIEPKAMDVLKAACGVLEGAQAMSFTAVSTYEKAARNGQPLFYGVKNIVTMQRPDKLRVITPGDGVPDEFYYDGKAMAVYVPSAEVAAVAEAPPTIDKMIDAAWETAAIYFPFADVIVSKPCDVFEKAGLDSAFYVGQSRIVGGTTTDMVAVEGQDIMGELWIGASDHLPRLVRVVYKHERAHALYQTEYSDWKLTEAAESASFASNKIDNARKIPFKPPGTGLPESAPAKK